MVRWKVASLVCLFSLLGCSLASKPEDIFKIVRFEDVSVVLGRTATLSCYARFIVTGIEVEYTIKKVSGAANTGTMEMVDGEARLTFPTVAETDDGMYICDATVKYDASRGFLPVTATATLTVNTTQVVFVDDTSDTTIVVVPEGGATDVRLCTTNQAGVAYTLLDENEMPVSNPSFDLGSSTGVLTVINYAFYDRPSTPLICLAQWTRVGLPMQSINRSLEVTISGTPQLASRLGLVYFYNITVDGVREYVIECNIAVPFAQLRQHTAFNWYFPATTQQVISRAYSPDSPYVDSQNRLVLTTSQPSQSGQYRCTATNAFGSSSTYSNVTISVPPPVFWVQYWMIIIYVVVGLALLILCLALCIRFCCLGFCYIKEKKVVVDSTFYTTTKFDDMEDKIPLQDKTEFQEVEVDMQLAGIQGEESDEDYDLPPEVDVLPTDIRAKYPWTDEEEASQLHRTEGKQLVRALRQTERLRVTQQEQLVDVRAKSSRRVRIQQQQQPQQLLSQEAEIQFQPEPVIIATPESQRKVDIMFEDDASPYDLPPVPRQVIVPRVVQKSKIVKTTKVIKVVKAEEEERPLIEEDAISGAESQVFEATFGMSDLESEDPPDSDFSM